MSFYNNSQGTIWFLSFFMTSLCISSNISFFLLSLGKPIDSYWDFYWFKMSCLSYLVFICVHCFYFKMMKLYKEICSAWISRTSGRISFLIDWRHKRLKNTIDLLLFYGEHFYGFSENVLAKMGNKVSVTCCILLLVMSISYNDF